MLRIKSKNRMSNASTRLTVQQLVDEHKVVLDVLLADLAKVGRHDITHLVEKLEHHRCVDILLGDCCQPDVGTLDVEKTGAGDIGHGRSDLLPSMNHVHAEGVHCITSATSGEKTFDEKYFRSFFFFKSDRCQQTFLRPFCWMNLKQKNFT